MALYQFSFEKLEIWRLARELAKFIYDTTRSFPADEKFGLVSQMRRAAVSVAANIAEGSSRNTAKDQAKFTTIAYSSLMELFNHLIISTDLGYISETEIPAYRQRIQLLSVKLSNFRASQIKRINKVLMAWLLITMSPTVQPLIPLI